MRNFWGFFLEFCWNSLRIFREFFGNSSGILWEYFGDYGWEGSDLGILRESFGNLLEFFGNLWLGGYECVDVDFG